MIKARQNSWLIAVALMMGLMGFFIPDSPAELRFKSAGGATSQSGGVNDHSATIKPRIGDAYDRSVTMTDPVSLQSVVAETDADPKNICRQIRDHVQYVPHVDVEQRGS